MNHLITFQRNKKQLLQSQYISAGWSILKSSELNAEFVTSAPNFGERDQLTPLEWPAPVMMSRIKNLLEQPSHSLYKMWICVFARVAFYVPSS